MTKKTIFFAALLFFVPIVLLLTGCEHNVVTPGGIVGKVTDLGGNNIAGARVWTVPATATTSSDALGNYSLPDLNIGAYTVYAFKEGYNDSANVSVSTGLVASADLALGTLITGETFENYALGPFSGGEIWDVYALMETTVEVTDHAAVGTKALRMGISDPWGSAYIGLTFPTAEVFSYSFYLKPSNSESVPQFLATGGYSGLLGIYYYDSHFYNVIGSVDPDLGVFTAGQWYKIKYRVDRVANRFSVWINDVLVIDNDNFSGRDIPDGIMLGAGLAGAGGAYNYSYFDNIMIYRGPE